MDKLERIVADVPDTLAAGIRSAVGAGVYASTSDAVRHALEHWLAGERPASLSIDDLRRLVEEGLDGDGMEAGAFFDQLDAKCAATITAADQTG